MAIRKGIDNVDMSYSTRATSGNVATINNDVDKETMMNNYRVVDSKEIENVELYADDSSEVMENIETSIKDNEQYVKSITTMLDEMDSNLNTLEEKYDSAFSIENNEIWYGNSIIMSNGDKPMTPKDYENILLGDFAGTYFGENMLEDFDNNKEMQDKIKLYTDTYNEIFKTLTNSDQTEDEYLNQIASIKNDQIMLNSSIYALKKENENLAIAKDEQKIINSDEFINWSKNELSMDELKAKYEEYQNMYLRIYDVPDLASQLDNFNPMWFCAYAEKLATEQGIDISDVINNQVVVYQENFVKIYEDYNVMSANEIQIFSFLYENEGRESALEYLDKKQNDFNQKIGMIEAQKEIGELSLNDEGKIKETLGNMLNVGTDGLGDGINSFFSGLENAIINNEKITVQEYKTAYYIQYLNQNSNYLDNIYQVGMSTGNMLPSVTASFVTSLIAPPLASKVGQVLMGVSAYGNSKHEALTNNYSVMTSVIYGLLSAGSEVLTEKMGGILGIADNPSSSFIMKMFDEGKEEFIQNYLMAGIDAIVLNKPINLDEINDEGLKSFLMGVIVAGNLNILTSGASGLSFIINNNNVTINSEQINQVIEQINENPNTDIKEILTNVNNEQSMIDEKLTRYQELMNVINSPEFNNFAVGVKEKLETEFNSIVKFLEKYVDKSQINTKMNDEVTAEITAELDEEITAEITAELDEEITEEIPDENPNLNYISTITKINARTQKGESVTIKVNDLKELNMSSLEKINDKSLVSFIMPNNETLSYNDVVENLTFVKIYEKAKSDIQTKIEERKLKDEILNTVKNSNYSEIEKIRKLYLELNKRVSYSPEYSYNRNNNNQSSNEKIYNTKLSFDTITSNKVICKGWAELYQELLISAGISPSNINIVGGKNTGSHKWIEVNMPNGDTIVADATEIIGGKNNDLINAKIGNRTSGFIIKPQSKEGKQYRISSEYKIKENINELNSLMNAWDDVDNVIGANVDGKYTFDLLQEAKENFGSVPTEEAANNILDSIFMSDVTNDLNGIEYYKYIKGINNQFGGISRIGNHFAYFEGPAGVDAINVLTFNGKYCAYSETYGKIITNNRQKMIQYLKDVNVSSSDIERMI